MRPFAACAGGQLPPTSRGVGKAPRLDLRGQLHAARQAKLARTPLRLPTPPVRLCLPAPAEEPMFILPVERPEPVLVEAAEREELRERRAA